MSSPDPVDESLELLAIERLDGGIDDERWGRLLAEHQAPLAQALATQQRLAQALRQLPAALPDPDRAQRILAQIPWTQPQALQAAAASPPPATRHAPSAMPAPAPQPLAPAARRWHPARWSAAAVLAACLVLALHLEGRLEVSPAAVAPKGSQASLPEHPAADVQEVAAAPEAAQEAGRQQPQTLGTPPRPGKAARAPDAAAGAPLVAEAGPRAPQAGEETAAPPPSADAMMAPPAAPAGDAAPSVASASEAPLPEADHAQSAAAPAPAPAAVGGSTPAPEPPAVAMAAPAVPRAKSSQALPARPAQRFGSRNPDIDLTLAPGPPRTLHLRIAPRDRSLTLAARSLVVVGYDLQGQRVWTDALTQPAQALTVDAAHPYRLELPLQGEAQVPDAVATIGISSPVGDSPLLPLPPSPSAAPAAEPTR